MGEVENITNYRDTIHAEFGGLALGFLPEKALWIKDLKTLLIADLHFGKANHFRKAGIPIPELVHDSDLIRLQCLHKELRPTHTYFLGDLFHSDWNEQWSYLNEFLAGLGDTQFHLVMGNHDILPPKAYEQSILRIHHQPPEIERLVLSHEPMKNVSEGRLNICGHIHPGVRLAGRARQSLMLPCFFQRKNLLLLPAFGNFTGLAKIRPIEQDKIWAIANENIIPVLSGTSIG